MEPIGPIDDFGGRFEPFWIDAPGGEIRIGVNVESVVISRRGALGRATVKIPIHLLDRVIATMQKVEPVARAATIPRNDTRYGAALELAKQFDKDRGLKSGG